MEVTREELEEIVVKAIKEHSCQLDQETLNLLNDKENRKVLRTIAEGLTPNSASMLARVGRMIDQVEFSLGTLILRLAVLGSIGLIIWLAFKKAGVHLEHN